MRISDWSSDVCSSDLLLAGLGNCVFHPADYSILSASIDSKRLGVAYGSHTFAGNLGWALAPALMGGVATFAGWHAAPLVAGIIGLVILAALVLNRDRKSTRLNSSP